MTPSRRAAIVSGLALFAGGPALAITPEKNPWPTGEARRAFKLREPKAGEELIRAFWLDGGRGREIWLIEARYDRARGPLLRQAHAIGRGPYNDYEFFRLTDRTVPMQVADYQALRDSCFTLVQDWLKTPAGFQGENVCLDWCGDGVEVAGLPGQPPLAITFDGAAEIIGARMRLAAKAYTA
ncbi:hypothetical protein QO010_001526 [Caulobacter ginsengisoli]|uniref:Twin-arginine translocation pathway signal n=1 Tax=Caulobacter ginsengisoli TaxID=400775 RepID=A0ABU0IQS9_9CAUL|nr:hypothetical protein [Caulobacter ginsengisoli]MDQ0463755.1 hypothetical protein [Caulobacter ginsengisoli]